MYWLGKAFGVHSRTKAISWWSLITGWSIPQGNARTSKTSLVRLDLLDVCVCVTRPNPGQQFCLGTEKLVDFRNCYGLWDWTHSSHREKAPASLPVRFWQVRRLIKLSEIKMLKYLLICANHHGNVQFLNDKAAIELGLFFFNLLHLSGCKIDTVFISFRSIIQWYLHL